MSILALCMLKVKGRVCCPRPMGARLMVLDVSRELLGISRILPLGYRPTDDARLQAALVEPAQKDAFPATDLAVIFALQA